MAVNPLSLYNICSAISDCKNYGAQVTCLINLSQGATGCVEIQIYDKNLQRADLSQFNVIQVLVTDTGNNVVAIFSEPPLIGNYFDRPLEILTDGLLKGCFTSEMTSNAMTGRLTAEIKMIKEAATGEIEDVVIIRCIQIGTIRSSAFSLGFTEEGVTVGPGGGGGGTIIGVTSGTSGTTGTSGTSGLGTSGTSGTSGDGTSGTSGTSGSDGTSGTSGFGTDGTSGTSGYSGTSGTSGVDGTSGTSGAVYLTSYSGALNYTFGVQSIYVPAGLSYTAGDYILVFYNPSTYLSAQVDFYDVSTGLLIFDAFSVVGSGIIDNTHTVNLSGYSGTSGTTGTSGTSGTTGTSGTSGNDGTSGTSGNNGTSGTSGSSGTRGTSGTSGTSGLAFAWQGSWSSSGYYVVNDVVLFNNATWLSLTNGSTSAPGSNPLAWSAMTTGGTSGSAGTSGTTGTSGTSGSSDRYVGSSTDSIDLSALVVGNSISITTTVGLSYTVAQLVTVGYSNNQLFNGQVISYNSSTGLLDLEITDIEGTGTYSSWTTNLGGAAGGDGTSGTSGSSGTSGPGGSSGTSGTSGTSGAAGSSGTSGAAGISGTSGTSGTSGIGTDGTSGTTGSSGTSGYGLLWLGDWVSSTPYGPGDIVRYGSPYKVYVSETNILSGQSAPDVNPDWGLMVESGTSGSGGTSGTSGLPGAPGTSGTSGTTGTSGSSGTNGTSGTTGTSGTSGSAGTSGSGTSGTSGTSFSSPYTGNLNVTSGQAWVSVDANGNTTANTTVDWNTGNVQTFTLNAATTTFTFSNGQAGATYILIIRQNSAGSQTIGWPGTVTWSSTPTMTATANRYDIYTFVYDGSKYFGSYVQNYV